jgi:hypothetical protein
MTQTFNRVVLSSCFFLLCGVSASAQSKNVVLAGNNAVINQEGQGRDFTVSGNHNEIHIRGDSNSVQITGNQNKIYLDRVDQIAITGAQNKVYYQSGITKSVPAISQFGVQNRVIKGGEKESALTDKSETAAEQPSASPGQPANSSEPSSEKLVLTGDGTTFNQAVNAKQVTVQGDRNQATLTGPTEVLVVTGDHNQISIEQIKSVQFVGDGNRVTYRSSPGGQKPEVASVGDNNSVSQGP